jgi:hypothetical protein
MGAGPLTLADAGSAPSDFAARWSCERRAGRESYLAATRFTAYRDLVPPVGARGPLGVNLRNLRNLRIPLSA